LQNARELEDLMCRRFEGAWTLRHIRLLGKNDLRSTGLDEQATVQR
jgi:hypothetical protein